MSYKPNSEGVRELRLQLLSLRQLASKVTEARKAVDNLKSLESSYESRRSAILDLLTEMDVTYNGNILWLLSELQEQEEQNAEQSAATKNEEPEIIRRAKQFMDRSSTKSENRGVKHDRTLDKCGAPSTVGM